MLHQGWATAPTDPGAELPVAATRRIAAIKAPCDYSENGGQDSWSSETGDQEPASIADESL